MSRAARAAERLAGWLGPRRCPLCGALLGPDAADRLLCPRCAPAAAALAHSLNPYGVLARGYTVVTCGGAVQAVETLRVGQQILLRGANAEADCTVHAVRELKQGGTKDAAAEII